MASAWFLDRERDYRRGIKLFCWKKELTEIGEVWDRGFLQGDKGTKTVTAFPTRAACVAAYERRCDEIAAEGTWIERIRMRLGRAAKRPSKAASEAELEATSAELATRLAAAKASIAKETAAIEKAVARYRAARSAAGEPPDEYIVHFFAVDGVGLAKARTPAFERASADITTRARWLAQLEALLVPAKNPVPAKKRTAAKKPAPPKKRALAKKR